MNPISLFTSFSGRINRAKWWIGVIVLTLVTMVGSTLVNPAMLEAFTNPEAYATKLAENIDVLKPTIGQLIFGLIMSILMLAVIFKRLNDRNWPSWLGMLIAVVYIGSQIAQYLMLQNVTSLADMGTATLPITIVTSLLFLFLLIDSGFLRGTVGPNQYGEDPLAHKNVDVA